LSACLNNFLLQIEIPLERRIQANQTRVHLFELREVRIDGGAQISAPNRTDRYLTAQVACYVVV